MAKSIEALQRDGIPPGCEGLADDAVELLSEAAADVLSERAGAIRPDEVPAPAPAPPAPDEAAMPVAEAVPPRPPAVAPMEDEEYESRGMALDRAALLRPPTRWQSDDEECRSDDSMVDAGPPIAAPETAPAPAPATTPQDVATALADLGVRVDMASAADNLFLPLLDKTAQAARPVEGVERIGEEFLPSEFILAASLADDFENGMLLLEAGLLLEEFLGKLLNRPPNAIESKFKYEAVEFGKQTFKHQAFNRTDLKKVVRTRQDQVEAFVASQRDRPYHGVSGVKGSKKNPWKAQVTIPAEHRKVRDKKEKVHLGMFSTKKAAACAVDRFIQDDYRFDEAYVSKYSNRINRKKDFETMTEEMKAAQEKGGRKAIKEAPAPAPAAPGGTAPGAAAKPQARKRARSPSRPTRADEAQRRVAQEPPRVLASVPTTTSPVPAGTAELAGAALARLGVKTVDRSANCAVARALLRVAQAARPDERLRKGKWPDEEFDLAEAFVAQFKSRTLPLKRGSLLRTCLSEVLNCDPMRITKKFAGDDSIGKQVFVLPQQNFDLDDVAQRLKPLVEAFIQAQARSRTPSPRAVPAPAPPPPPLPEGVPPPPANVAQPVAAPAPAAPVEPMTDN